MTFVENATYNDKSIEPSFEKIMVPISIEVETHLENIKSYQDVQERYDGIEFDPINANTGGSSTSEHENINRIEYQDLENYSLVRDRSKVIEAVEVRCDN